MIELAGILSFSKKTPFRRLCFSDLSELKLGAGADLKCETRTLR